jgi:ribosomal protein S18 acetylase RimI-like enzyme
MRRAVPEFVYANFYPNGWGVRQLADLGTVLDDEPNLATVAKIRGRLAGWVSIRLHPEDRMGEIYVLCVDPQYQRRGIGRQLMDQAHQQIQRAGMKMVMVETGGDPGHDAARSAYEAAGYQRWPVARYFKEL